MYEEFFGHFGLQRNPFHVSPNPQSFYSTPTHNEALSQLIFGIEARQGLMVLTGEPGTGKTTILRYLLKWLEKHKYSTAYVFHPLVASLDLLRLILCDFGVSCESHHKCDLLIALRDWLVTRHERGDRPVIFIDEAQGLTGRALEELRLLLNLQKSGVQLVQLVLAGQPQLAKKLKWRELAQLRQRIAFHCKLVPLTREETAGYIHARLHAAGGRDAAVFPQRAVDEIYRYSQGIPRVVHLLCEHALLAASADRRDSVTGGDVLRVAQQFELTVQSEQSDVQGAFRSDTFCRLIPLAKLNAAAQLSRNHSPEPALPALPLPGLAVTTTAPPAVPRNVPLASAIAPAAKESSAVEPLLAPKSTISATTPLPAPTANRITRKPATTKTPVSRALAAYWSAVGKSLSDDLLECLGPCAAWLRRPVPKKPALASLLGVRIGHISAWLRLPFGSRHAASQQRLPGQTRRAFSQKHF